jgi:RHS repeat-associated protein
VRANTQGEPFAYYPYGEERTNRPDARDKFATYFRDGVGQDYAEQRYYGAATGRFWSADPAGMAAAKSGNPGIWNQYAYTYGDPVNGTDRHGAVPCFLSVDGCPPLIEGDGGGCFEVSVLPYETPGGDYVDGDVAIVCTDSTSGSPASTTASGPPTQIPCEIDASIINNYIASTPIYGNPTLSKPLAGMGQAFIDAALKYDTNPAVLVAIAFQESHWGFDQRNTGTNNAFGLLHADGTFLTFDSWQAGIMGATRTVDSAYDRGNRSVADLYSGLPGAYCTHAGCSCAISGLEKRVRALGEDPDYLGFDCIMKDGVLVKR